MKHSIDQAEQQLTAAIVSSDVQALEKMIHNDAIFTDQTGTLVAKSTDLELHRSGKLVVDRMVPSEQQIRITDDVAIVSVKQEVAGSYDGTPFSGSFRYLRVWKNTDGRLQIIAASCTAVSL